MVLPKDVREALAILTIFEALQNPMLLLFLLILQFLCKEYIHLTNLNNSYISNPYYTFLKTFLNNILK